MPQSKKDSRQKESITEAVNNKNIDKHERGMPESSFPKECFSTIYSILKEKVVDEAKGALTLTSKHLSFLEKAEKILMVWVHEMVQAGVVLTKPIIGEKAKTVYNQLLKEQSHTDNLKKRSGIFSVRAKDIDVNLQAAVIQESEEVEDYSYCFLGTDTVAKGDLLPKQKPGLRTFIAEEDETCEEDFPTLFPNERNDEKVYQENKGEKAISSPDIKDIKNMLNSWDTIARFLKKYHPNHVEAIKAIDTCNNSAMSHFCEVINTIKEQTLDHIKPS